MPVKPLLRRFVPPTPVVVATSSSTPMPPNGGSPGSGLGASISSRRSQRSRSRSPLVPKSDDDVEEEQSDESVGTDESGDSFDPRRRGSSDKLNKAISRGVRKTLRKRKGKGEGVLDGVLEQILAQERRVALLENQGSQIAGESGLIYSFLDFKLPMIYIYDESFCFIYSRN